MVDPWQFTATEWTDIVGYELENAFRGIIRPVLTNGEDWRNWADLIIDNPGIREASPPRPEGYETWQDWAREFNIAVRY